MLSGWNHQDSPFHAGEQQVQERLGVRERIETFARRVVRDHMPDQHRDFYAELPFVLIGSVDERGQPWASILAGHPGFMTTPDAKTLDIEARPLFGDPLNVTAKAGADVGLLGIELETRRRNRLTGRISAARSDGFTIAIKQAFGNCPQYIQTRAVTAPLETDPGKQEYPLTRSEGFDAKTRALIERADTLFIATAYTDGDQALNQGADVSHRGGKPGFVKVLDDRTFGFPDFSGNNHFNTVGNIVLNPKAGFLFVDFETRDLAYMTGTAEIVWDGQEVRTFAGAERLIRFRASEVIRVERSLPLGFTFGDYSPVLEHTGSWSQTADVIAAEQERNAYVPFEIVEVTPESKTITSFHLRRADGKASAKYEPGQFLPIRVQIPNEETAARRTYTLSDAPNGETYRLSIKREGGDALVSTFLHDHARAGFRLEAMAPRGKFVLDQSSDRPVVLISAGVGITPMIAMTKFIINEGLRTRNFRRTYFVHGPRNSDVHGNRPIIPPDVALFAEDSTAEALALDLGLGRPSSSLWSDEAGLVIGGHAMSAGSVMRFLALLNRLWDGNAFIQRRATRESVEIRGRRLTVSLMAQPNVVQELIGGYGGLARGIGLLARFLICWPASTIGQRPYRPGDLDADALRAFDSRVTNLLSHPLPIEDEVGMVLKPPVLDLEPAAFKIWRVCHDQAEATLGRHGEYAELTDLGAKIAEQAARIACVMHVFEHGPVGSIPPETMQAGADIAIWHLHEARRVFGLVETDEVMRDAELLLDWLSAQNGPSTLKHLAQCAPHRLRKKDRRDDALSKLTAHGLARRETLNGSTVIVLNPAWEARS